MAAALAANAIYPLRGTYTAIPGFFAGWLAGELAPQLLAIGAADTAQSLVRRRAGHTDLVAAAAALGGLAWLVLGADRVGSEVETTLRESLGEEYQSLLHEPPDPSDLATAWRDLRHPFRMVDTERVSVERNVQYAPGGRRHRLDVFRPKDRPDLANAPVLLQIHGGGWTIGRKEEQGQLLMNRMASRGWVCVAINYRLAPKHPWPAMIVDVKKALAWVREHIEDYGGDPSHIVLTGGSAGGHLAALAALTANDPDFQPGFEDADTSVTACLPFYGVYDLAGLDEDPFSIQMRDHFLAPRVFKRDPRTDLDTFVRASPLARVHADAPDFFLFHGSHDTLVHVTQARRFARRLREVSRRSVTYAELPGAQHAFEVFGSVRSLHVIKAASRWLEWQYAHDHANDHPR